MDERTLFLTALEKSDPAEREDWLAKACGDNAALRQRVESLLRTHDDAGSFLEHPPADCLAATAVSDPSMAKRPPALEFLSPSAAPGCLGELDHYEVLQEVGRGGMGVVLKARDTKLERIVAIKVLAPELAANGMARKRFLREAKAAAAVAHPHVVAIHSIDEHRPYLVMEYIEGQSLKDKIDRTGALELKEILRIGSQIAAGLAAAHKQGLIHRDIKPANILLENGVQRVKITDFGLARAVDDIALTRTGEVAGTPQFMSPEQAQGHAVDHRSDLFSLGSVLYTLCTGRTPFRGDSTIAVIRRVCDDTPRPIRETNPDVPEWLCHIIDRLLEKDPADRFQAAEEVSDLLAQHLAHEQQPQVTPQPAPLPRRTPTNHAAALKALRGPARGLIVTACVNWIAMIVLLLVGIAVLGQFPGHFALGAAEAILVPVLILGSSLILWGGLRMLNGESYGLCVFASVLAMLIGPGYFVGWPVGIWSLIVLTRPEVRDLFRRRKETAAPSRRATETSEESAVRRTGGASWMSWLAAGLLMLVFVVGAINVFHDLTALPAPSTVRALGLIAGGLMFLLLASRVAEAPLLKTGLDWLAGFALLFGGGELIRSVLPQAEALFRGNGTLVVQTDDPTVEVFIDGQNVPLSGRQTLELETFPGTHMVEFRRDSRQLSQHVLRIKRGEMAVARWSNDQSRAIAGLPAATAGGASPLTLPVTPAAADTEAEIRAIVSELRRAETERNWPQQDLSYARLLDAHGRLHRTVEQQYHAGVIPLHKMRESKTRWLEVLNRWIAARARNDVNPIEPDLSQYVSQIGSITDPRTGTVHLPGTVVAPGMPFQESAAAARNPKTRAADDWRPLFNNRDLTGWLTHPDEPGDWHVENGVLTSGSQPAYLYSATGDYQDFHLLCEARINAGGDGGVMVRAPFERGRKEGLPGYEAQISAGPPVVAGWATGAIGVTDSQRGWRMLQPSTAAVNPGEWFFLEVIARGNRVGTWVNGVKVAEFTDPEQRFQRGRIVLQSSGAGTRLEFRRIEMRPPTDAPSDVELPLSAARPENVR